MFPIIARDMALVKMLTLRFLYGMIGVMNVKGLTMRLRLRVGAVMRERGVSVAELAKSADIATNTARALYRGVNERVDLVVLGRVAAALGARPIELFEEVEESGHLSPEMAVA